MKHYAKPQIKPKTQSSYFPKLNLQKLCIYEIRKTFQIRKAFTEGSVKVKLNWVNNAYELIVEERKHKFCFSYTMQTYYMMMITI